MFVDLMADIRTTLGDRLFKARMMAPQPLRAPQITRTSGPSLDTTEEGYAPGAAAAGRQSFSPTGVAVSAGVAAPAVTGGAVTGVTPAAQPGTPLPSEGAGAASQAAGTGEKIGRNDPCPCGSGRKYKKCHGRPGAPPL
jgi:preprotein translocase subunit SecA